MLSIGLMSGTSMDGIDAALLETDGENHIKELGHASIDYDPRFKILLKAAEYAVKKCNGKWQEALNYYQDAISLYLKNELKINESELNNYLLEITSYFNHSPIQLETLIEHSTKLHAHAVRKLLTQTRLTGKEITVVGYHGQTLYHQPNHKISIIVGDGQYLSNAIEIPVVNDFRRQDIEAGGEGAPLAPYYHFALARRDKKIPAIVINCGGIANVTIISTAQSFDLMGFDTGPGNVLIDSFVRRRTCGKENMDKDGQYGKKGKVHQEVIKILYQKSLIKDCENYYLIPPPKSLDYGDITLIPELDSLSLEDGCATLGAFTADTIIQSLKFCGSPIPKYWVLAGGGWKNPIIRSALVTGVKEKYGEDVQILTADEMGWNSQGMEAQIFSFFAVRRLHNKPITFPGTTRVSHPMIGGTIYHPCI